MREYSRVYAAFWTSPDVQSMSDDGRLLALYLLTSPHTTIVGAFRMPDGYACEDLKWTPSRVAKGFAELSRKGFANRCETTKWAWISKFLDWNPPENPNQWKAARKVVAQIPDSSAWKPAFMRVFATLAGDQLPPESNPLPNPFGTLSESGTGTGTGTGTGGLQTSVGPKPDRAAVSAVFEHWQNVHRHPQAKLDAKRRKVITAALDLYAPEQLCEAISGYRNSPHHMGQNDRQTVYDDIEIFLRDAKHIDAGLRLLAEPPRTDQSTLTRKNVAAVSDWKPPEMRRAAS